MKFKPGNKRWMIYSISIALMSWAGLWSIIQSTVNVITKTLFLFLLFSAITSTIMPAAAYLNTRFGTPSSKRIYQMRFIRQSVWGGLFIVGVAWLQMQRVLGVTLGFILLSVFILIETFLITRESPVEKQ